jgi:hypothetical protein
VSHGEDWSFVFEKVATMQKRTVSLGKMMLAAVGTISLITLASWVWQSADTLVPDELIGEWHSFWQSADTLVPVELIGEWHTSNAIYSDRSFEIDPVSISFGTGGGTVTTGFIRKVSAVQQGARTLYTISYQTDESVNEVCLYYETAEGKVIHFRNQESIAWTKD